MAGSTVGHEKSFDKVREVLNEMSLTQMGALSVLIKDLQRESRDVAEICDSPEGETTRINVQALLGIAELLNRLHCSFMDCLDDAILHLPNKRH